MESPLMESGNNTSFMFSTDPTPTEMLVELRRLQLAHPPLCSARGGARGATSVPTRTAVPSLPVCHAGAARPTVCLAEVSVGSGASVHTAHPRKSLGIYMGAHPGRNGHPGRAHCCPSGPCTAHVQGGPWGTWCSCWTTTARPVGAAQACWPLGVQAFHSPMKSCRNL